MYAVIAVLNTASYLSLIHICEPFEYEEHGSMTEMLFILVLNSFFAGAMQQYENELFDVFQSNHQNHLYYNVILFFETKLSFN